MPLIRHFHVGRRDCHGLSSNNIPCHNISHLLHKRNRFVKFSKYRALNMALFLKTLSASLRSGLCNSNGLHKQQKCKQNYNAIFVQVLFGRPQ